MQAYGFGQSLLRKEEWRLLTGRGRFTGDIDLPRQAHGQVLRSPHAHAEIRAIDASAAQQAPGVLVVLTGFPAERRHSRWWPGMPWSSRERKSLKYQGHKTGVVGQVRQNWALGAANDA